MAAEDLDLTAFDYALKELYPPIVLETKFFKDNPFLGMVNKKTTFPGRRAVIPVRYVNPQGRSATFSFAQSNQRPGAGIDFLVPRVRDYGLVTIDNETMEASMDDIGSFITARKSEIDGIIDQTTRSLATALYGSGRGDVGQVGSVVGTTITLKVLSDATNFEVNQVLVASATQTGALRAAGVNIMEITAIDYDLGTLEVDATITGLAADDFLFVQGDHVAAADRLKVTGLQGWIPSTAPVVGGGDSFFGVDRSTNPTRLAGIRHDGTGSQIEDELVRFVNKVNRLGGVQGSRLDYAYCHPTQFSKVVVALGAKVQYVNPSAGGEANIGYTGIKINGLKGPVTLLPDVNCPNAKIFACTMDAWTFQSIGPAPKIYNADGVTMLRQTSADAVEIRCRYYGNLWTDAPVLNGVMAVDEATE